MTENAKITPQALDLEEAVLGAILLDKDSLRLIMGVLSPVSFYNEKNGRVFLAASNLFNNSSPVDILTVTQELKRMGQLEFVGGAYYVSSLTNRIASAANIEFHARIVQQKYLLRELIRISNETLREAYDQNTDVFELIAQTEKSLMALTQSLGGGFKHIKEVHTEIVKEQKEVLAGNVKTGIMSGLYNLDRITGGWQNGNLIIVGARPAMGKSAFALQLAKYPAMNQNIPVALFSMEMTGIELGCRLIASETGLNNTKIIQKGLNSGELMYVESNVGDLINAPIYMDDTPGLSINQLKNKARKLYYDKGVRMFVIDYLQLATGDGNNKEQQVSDISRGLKILAKELNVPVIALCQLNRGVEARPDKRPLLSDLRDSGAIEQDADIVMFLFRPAYYEFLDPYQFGNYTLDPTDLLIVDIAKGRALRTGETPLKFIGEQMIVKNYDL